MTTQGSTIARRAEAAAASPQFAIAYLCSEESSFITAAVVAVDSGRVSVL
jgi:hypothetical protein